MDYDAQEVLVGLGKLLVDGSSVGYTSGGVALVRTQESFDKEVDQAYGLLGIHKVRESFEIRTNLAQASLTNLKLAWDQTESVVTGAGTRSLSWGMNPNVIEHTLVFYGKSPEGFDRTFTVRKAVVMETGEMNHAKDALTLIPITFRVLPDTTMAAGQEYGTIEDVTA